MAVMPGSSGLCDLVDPHGEALSFCRFARLLVFLLFDKSRFARLLVLGIVLGRVWSRLMAFGGCIWYSIKVIGSTV